ncbi:MAG TPA: bifunctional riboflavin kinase/FAD synthetase [Firmicutes bacterium]|nr:bifunctional riboflavin kinase/FAD synthetase [Bacillota bacterium]
MDLITDLKEVVPRLGLAHTSVALGMFDGVHRGHQAVLRRAVARAREEHLISVAFTFDRHPFAVTAPDRVPPLITPIEEKARLISDLGLDVMVVYQFDEAFASMDPADFAASILKDSLRASRAVVGYNYTFGKGGRGSPELLKELGLTLGFGVDVIGPVTLNGMTVGSTEIRTLLSRGDVRSAAMLLGRPFSIRGRVVKGYGRGSRIGFPTANVAPPAGVLIPREGVYAVRVLAGNASPGPGHVAEYTGVANIGFRPTFSGKERTIEVYILDFSGNIYGSAITVQFIDRIRSEIKFDRWESLRAQIDRDVEIARSILAGRPDSLRQAIYKDYGL